MSTPNEENNVNPHIEAALKDIPDEFRGILEPRLREWDTNSTQKIQSVQSEYEPYKELIDQGYEPQIVMNAIAFAQNLEADPKGMVKRIADHFQIDPVTVWENLGQGQKDEVDEPDLEYDELGDLSKHPVVQQLLQSQQQLQSFVESQQEGQVNAEAEAALDAYLEELHEQHGDFDETYVLALIGTGMQGEDAVQQFKTIGETYFSGKTPEPEQQQTQDAPVVAGSQGNTGTGLPDPTNSPKLLDRKSTNDLVEQILRNAGEPERNTS